MWPRLLVALSQFGKHHQIDIARSTCAIVYAKEIYLSTVAPRRTRVLTRIGEQLPVARHAGGCHHNTDVDRADISADTIGDYICAQHADVHFRNLSA